MSFRRRMVVLLWWCLFLTEVVQILGELGDVAVNSDVVVVAVVALVFIRINLIHSSLVLILVAVDLIWLGSSSFVILGVVNYSFVIVGVVSSVRVMVLDFRFVIYRGTQSLL